MALNCMKEIAYLKLTDWQRKKVYLVFMYWTRKKIPDHRGSYCRSRHGKKRLISLGSLQLSQTLG